LDANIDQLLQKGYMPESPEQAPVEGTGGMITMEVTPEEAQMIEEMRGMGVGGRTPLDQEMNIDSLMQKGYGNG
jgi:hypothetical protein